MVAAGLVDSIFKELFRIADDGIRKIGVAGFLLELAAD
jgi:hypothetical protein